MVNNDQIVSAHNLFAENIGHWGIFNITNSLLNSWLSLLVVLLLVLIVRRQLSLRPGLLQSLLELVVEQFLKLADGVTSSRSKSLLFAPVVLSFFFFILINNWLGILPGVGSIGRLVLEDGQTTFIPFFRGATADLNTTLALASLAVLVSHVVGVVMLGPWQHLNKFLNLQALAAIPQRLWQEPTILLVNPIKFFVGLIEIIGELAKLASLAFRLFGNIFAGEVLLASMSALLAWVVPVPFMFLEILVGVVQALIFSLLVLIYLSSNATSQEH